METIQEGRTDVRGTAWGGWIARTPMEHRFRLAAVGTDRAAVVRDLAEAVDQWNRLAGATAP